MTIKHHEFELPLSYEDLAKIRSRANRERAVVVGDLLKRLRSRLRALVPARTPSSITEVGSSCRSA